MQHLQPNTLLQGGKYKIEKVLGQGGFGITYLAEQPMLHRKVAVKEFFMKDFCNRDESTSQVSIGSMGSADLVGRFREKFLKEASMIAGMNNHHIVSIYDIFEENGTAYYIMEHIDGGSMDSLLKEHILDEATALKYTRELADALDYIHQQNILHLDVKPANILLRKNGEAVLIDFGISKRYDEQGGQTSTTPAGLSKGYAPIEQYNQGVANFSPATDIYSLGATLYKMVTGVTPPEASLLLDEDEELEKPKTISFTTWVAIEKAMEPRRKKRPQTISEFLSMLGEVAAPEAKPQTLPKVNEETVILKPRAEETIVQSVEVKKPLEDGEKIPFEVKGVKFNMVFVKGGTFDMTETVSSGFLGLSTKEICQKTTLSDYMIGETVVTQALWRAVMGSNPSNFEGDNLPVESVSWNDCQDFIEKLNALTGKNFRLPTEAEWEFAARGGNKSKGYIYSGSDDINEVAWYFANANGESHDVVSKKTNELGVYNMSGNVWECCSDFYGNYYEGAQTNPTGPKSGTDRVIRGGSRFSDAGSCDSSYRNNNDPDNTKNNIGLRLALSE